jgi:hypothetical protein
MEGISHSASIHLSGRHSGVGSASPSTSVPSHSYLPALPTRFSGNLIRDIAPLACETPTRTQANEISNSTRFPISRAPAVRPPQSSISWSTPSSSRPSPYKPPSSLTSHRDNGLTTRSTVESIAKQFTIGQELLEDRAGRLLDALKQAMPCSLCWLFSDGAYELNSHDSAFYCPRNIMNTPGYHAFKTLEFLPNSRMCYKCCEPQWRPFSHPKGTSGCTYNDVIKPIAYVIFEDHRLRGKIFEKMGLPADYVSSIVDYKEWLAKKQTVPGAMHNIHEVILAYHELYPYGGTTSD